MHTILSSYRTFFAIPVFLSIIFMAILESNETLNVLKVSNSKVKFLILEALSSLLKLSITYQQNH